MNDMNKAQRILLIAPNIPQLYVAIEFIKKMKTCIPNAKFIISSRDKYQSFISEDINIKLVGLFPEFVKQINKEEVTCIVFIGHSYFLDRQTVTWAANYSICVCWIHAHFEKTDLMNWIQDKTYAKKLIHTFDLLFYENPEDLYQLQRIGFSSNQLHFVKNAKYDCAYPTKEQILRAQYIIHRIGAMHKKIIVAGSVANGLENKFLLETFSDLHKKFPDVVLVLAPRIMEHISSFINEITVTELLFSRTSNLNFSNPQSSILLVDQMGLLKGFYRWASIAFIGRTLVKKSGGGSNIMEPASQSVPIIIGPHTNGISTVLQDFIKEDAILQLSKSSELLETFTFLLSHQRSANTLGKNAYTLVQKYAGGLQKTASFITDRYLIPQL